MKEGNKKKGIQTIWGFPVCDHRDYDDPSTLEKVKTKGISLMIALMTTTMMMGFVVDLIITSSVNLELAVSGKDRVKAEYMLKSGYNLATFLESISWGVSIYRAQPSAPEGMKEDLNDSFASMWNTFNSMPPIGSVAVDLVNSMKKGDSEEAEDIYKLGGVFGEDVSNLMSLFRDEFTIQVIDEGSKINVNDCMRGRCSEVLDRLIALFSCPAEKLFLESKNITPTELAYRIKDFITESNNTSEESGLNDKNDPYMAVNPPYKTKGLPFDTVDELKLVHGWDDEIHMVFSPYITVYPFNNVTKNEKSKVNINTAPRELLGCMIPDARSESCAKNFTLKMNEFKSKNRAVTTGNISETMNQLMCYSGQSGENELSSNPVDWFDNKSEVFRTIVTARTGNQERRLETVIRRIMPRESNKKRDNLKVKRSYELLYWKMI